MRLANLFAIISIATLGAACDGESGDGFADELFGQTGNGQFNGPLRGLILKDGKLVDLASGVVRVIVPEYNDGDIPLVNAGANASEFVELEQRCDFADLASFDCLIFRDAQGMESIRYRIDNWALQGRLPGLSPDGQLITVLDVNSQTLLIMDRAGNIIDHSRQRIADASWAQDGALVYSSGQSIYRVAPAQLTHAATDTLIQSFDESAGKPVRLSVSPDGSRIAVALATAFTIGEIRSTVWTINNDGSNPQPFARSRDGFVSRVGWPLWSPDGQWILVRQATLPPDFGPGRAGSHTALRSDMINHELGTESDVQIKLRAVCFRNPECNQHEVNVLNPGPIAWVAAGG